MPQLRPNTRNSKVNSPEFKNSQSLLGSDFLLVFLDLLGLLVITSTLMQILKILLNSVTEPYVFSSLTTFSISQLTT